MSSNLISQLKEAGAIDRLDEVLKDISLTRKELGYPPLVTPMSQMVGSQAVSNVLFGRYKMVSNQVKEYLTGMDGRPPSKVDSQIKEAVFKFYDTSEIKTINERPGNLIEPELKEAEKAVADITSDVDDILIYALYPTTGMKFLRVKHGLDLQKDTLDLNADGDPSENHEITATGTQEVPVKSLKTRSFNVFIDDIFYKVEIDPVDQNMISISDGIRNPEPSRDSNPTLHGSSANSDGELKSPMPGVILKYLVEVDQQVNQGDPIAVLEAMKMENTLPSPKDGRIQSLTVEPGQTVVKGDLLAIIT
jgi:pyruvate carboxylase subunit B